MTDGPRHCILIVDDNTEDIRVLARLLKGSYRQMVATNGPKALEMVASRTPPDLILLDVLMPQMDGYEVCRRLKADEKNREIPVVFITAMNDEEDETKGFELGAVDYITKPFSPSTVKARVRTHLELKEKREIIKRKQEKLELAHQQLVKAMNRVQADIQHAAEIQSGMLPSSAAQPFPEALTIARRFRPEMDVGGDFFDFARIDNRHVAVILADVSGHGLQAAFITGLIKAAFELGGESRMRPEHFAVQLNHMLLRLTPSHSFATMLYSVYDAEKRMLRYLNAGHAPLPILITADGQTAPVSLDSNMLLGVTEIDAFTAHQFTIPQGAKLLLATDGFVDAVSPADHRFGFDRLVAAVRKNARAAATQLEEAIFEELREFTRDAHQSDDIATLIIEFH